MRRSSGMQKVLCGTIFLNQVRNSYIVMKPHNSSTEVLAEPTESATKPSSGFVLKDIKSCIFQIPSNPCVLIKNVVWPVNFCRGLRLCYSVLENGEKKKQAGGVGDDRISWEQESYAAEMWHVPQPHFREIEVQPVSRLEGSGGLGQAHRAQCHGDGKLCPTGRVPKEQQQAGLTSSLRFSYNFSEVLKLRNLPHALCIIGNIYFCEWL